MIPENTCAVILAFYSKGRKAFVPLMAHEITKRAKLAESTAMQAVADAYEYGWVGSMEKNKITTWHLTDKGQKAARTLMQAAEMEKSA